MPTPRPCQLSQLKNIMMESLSGHVYPKFLERHLVTFIGELRVLLVLCLASGCGCRAIQDSTLKVLPQNDCAPASCKYQIDSLEDFEELAGVVSAGGFDNQIVKAVYLRDRVGSGRMYFVNTKIYKYHYDFASQALGIRLSLVKFNENYTGSGRDRDLNLVSLVRYPQVGGGRGAILLEFWSGDTIETDYIKEVYEKLKQMLPSSVYFAIHPLSAHQEALIQSLKSLSLPIVTTEELFQDREYISLNQGVAYGYLQQAGDSSSTNDEKCLDHSNIVIFDKVPAEIGLYSGVITSEFQTPLSHVNVKSINRGTPNMVLTGATQKLSQYLGKGVELTVSGNEYNIRLLDPATADREISRFWDLRRPVRPLQPESKLGTPFAYDLWSFDKLFPANFNQNQQASSHKQLTSIFGAKATNIALISSLITGLSQGPLGESLDVKSPAGYGLSFDFYEQFMNHRQTNIDPENPNRVTTPKTVIQEILTASGLLNDRKLHSICKASPTLAKVRQVVSSAQTPPSFKPLFKKVLIEDPTSVIHQKKVARIRLRSSTNSEDLQGFNGAGLYNSAGVSLYEKGSDGGFDPSSSKSFEKIWGGRKGLNRRIAAVYASVWNDRAFSEREWFRINGLRHLNVKMGLAIHRAFPRFDLAFDDSGGRSTEGELANGVAVTKNIYQETDEPLIYLNGQHFDLAVTNPPTASELAAISEDPGKPYRTEELLVRTYSARESENNLPDSYRFWSFEYLSRSSVKGGLAVLSDDFSEKSKREHMEVRRLTHVLKYLADSMARVYGVDPLEFVLDS
jgi:pyruvate, water dikinase